MPLDFAESKCEPARAVECDKAPEPTPAFEDANSRDSQRNFSNWKDAQGTVNSTIDQGGGGLQIVDAKAGKEHSVLTKVTTWDKCGNPHTEVRDPKEHSILTKVTLLDKDAKDQQEKKQDPKEHSVLTKVTELDKDGKNEAASLKDLQKQAKDVTSDVHRSKSAFDPLMRQYTDLQKMWDEAKQLSGDSKATMESVMNAALKDKGHKVSIIDSNDKNAPRIFWQKSVEAIMTIDPKESPGNRPNMGRGIIGLGHR